MSLASTNKLDILIDRAHMLKMARRFFDERSIIEVDCPILSQLASVDAHIDLVEAVCCKRRAFLHSSPEYGMKRLLAMGYPDCFQLSHVFRDHERSKKHQPEFLMAEWYRRDVSLNEMIRETHSFAELFLGPLPLAIRTVNEVIFEATGLEYETTSWEEWEAYFQSQGEELCVDTPFHQLMPLFVEPSLGQGEIVAIVDFPSTEAALAKIEGGFAKRFELFHRGLELANGYEELTDADELRSRFTKTNEKRSTPYPIDERLLQAMELGLPDCSGVAVGVDRLMMLRHGADTIHEVIPFGFEEA